MQTFFNRLYNLSGAAPISHGWEYCEKELKANLAAIETYYKSRRMAVKSNHVLCKMLNSLGVSLSHHPERFYNIVSSRMSSICMANKFTSPIHRGKIFAGVFYGAGVQEVIVADDAYQSPYEILRDWKNYKAIEVIEHPVSDLTCHLPKGLNQSYETGRAVIKINVPGLALQWWCFIQEEASKLDNPEELDSLQTTAMFVHRYALTSMLESHLDVALFNRIVNKVLGKPMGEKAYGLPFYTTDLSKRVDDVYKKAGKVAYDDTKSFQKVMNSFPLAFKKSVSDLMELPDIAPTRQYLWVEMVARLKCLEWLTAAIPDAGKAASSQDRNRLYRALKTFSVDGSFFTIEDETLKLDVASQVKEVWSKISTEDLRIRY